MATKKKTAPAPAKKALPAKKAATKTAVKKTAPVKKAAPAAERSRAAVKKPVGKAATAPQLEVCQITFPFTITERELPAFRGAIIAEVQKHKAAFAKAGLAADLFHNHDEEAEGRRHLRPPAVVYQLVRVAGGGPAFYCPALTGFGAGAAALQLLAQRLPAMLQVYRRGFATRGYTLESHRYPVQPLPEMVEYRLQQWLALNPDNYTAYKINLRFTARVTLLEGILHKNILGWYAARGHQLQPQQLRLFITEITAIQHSGTELNGRNMFVFDCCFAANLSLPPQMALGNGGTWGYGQVKPLNTDAAHKAALRHTAAVL